MAEIQFRVLTDWQEVEKLVRELENLQKTISGVNTDLPRTEIDKLVNKLTTLKEKYSEIVSFASRANADISDIFSKKGAFRTSPTGDLAQGVADDMKKVQSSVTETLQAIQEKIDEFKKGVEDAFSFTADIKIPDSSSEVLDTVSGKLSALNEELSRQQIITSQQTSQNQTILQQQQQETTSITQQGVQMQSLTGDVKERADAEGDVQDAVDKSTESVKSQTDAIKEQTDALEENKKARNKPDEDERYGDSAKEEQRNRTELLASYREELAKLEKQIADAPQDSEEQQRAIARYNTVKEQIAAIENGEEQISDQLSQESEKRDEINRKLQEEYSYLDEIRKKNEDGNLTEKERLDTIEKINAEIQERQDKIGSLRNEQQSIPVVESKYENGIQVNLDEEEEALRKFEEYNQKIDEQESRVGILRQALAGLTGEQVAGAQEAGNAIDQTNQKTKDFLFFLRSDENGNTFEVVAKSAEEADRKIEETKGSLEVYPQLLDRIKKKAEEMRSGAYMTDEGERLMKDALNIEKALQGRSLSGSFPSGVADTVNKVNELTDIEEKLDSINQEQKEIEAENQRIAEAEEKARLEAEEHANSTMRLRTRIMEAREEMARMIAEGKKGTPEFQELAQEAGEMRDQMQEASASLTYYSDNQRSLNTLKTGLQGVAGAAGLVTSVMGMFNEDSKKMLEIQTKIQSVLGIVVGLETTYNLVKKESFVRLAAEEVWTWAVTKARGAQAAATTTATVAQERLNVAMMKNPYGAIIALLITLGAAIYGVVKALSSETEEEKKAAKARKEATEEAQRLNNIWMQSATESAAKQIVAYQKLQDKWNELGSDLKKKEQFVRDNKKVFNDLGFAINTVSEAESLLVKNTDAVVSAIMARAKAAAYEKVAAEEIEKQVRLQLERGTVENGGYRKNYKKGQRLSIDEAKKLQEESGVQLIGAGSTSTKGVSFSTDVEVSNESVVNDAAEKAALARQRRFEKEKKQKIKESKERLELIKENAKKEYDAEKYAIEKTGLTPFEPKSDKGNNNKNYENRNAKEIADELKFQEKLADIEQEGARKRTDALIAAERNNELRERKQREEQHRRTIEDLEDYQDIYREIYQQRKQDYENKNSEKGLKYENTTAGAAGYQDPKAQEAIYKSLTDDEKKLWDARVAVRKAKIDEENENEKRRIEDLNKQQIESMRGYLKEYGTFQQQKLAIAEEYAQKIKEAEEAGNTGKVMQLQKEQQQAEANVEFKAIEQKINWYSVFDNLGLVMKGALEEQMNMLREYVKSPKFQQLQPEQKQTVVNAMSNIRQSIGSVDDLGFHDLAMAVMEYQQALQEQIAAQKAYEEAEVQYGEELKLAKERLAKTDPQDTENYQAAENAVNYLQSKMDEAGNTVTAANKKVQTAGHNLAVTTKDVTQPISEITAFLQQTGIPQLGQLFASFDQLKGGIDGLKALKEVNGKELSDAGKEMAEKAKKAGEQAGEAVKESGEKLGKTLEKGGFIAQIISAILSILDILKDGIGTLISNILDTVLNAVNGILENILSGDFIMQIGNSLINGIGSILNTITFGGFDSWFGIGNDNHEEMLDIQKQAKDQLELISDRVSRISEKLDKSYGMEAVKTAEELEKYIKSSQDQIYTGLMAAGWDNYGGGHSEWWHRNENGGKGEGGHVDRLTQWLLSKYGLNFKGSGMYGEGAWQDFFYYLNSLGNGKGAEILHDLREDSSMQEVWYELMRTNSYDEGTIADWVKQWADSYDQLADAQEKLNERLTTTTSDNVFDSYLSSLYDFADGVENVTENVADDWQKMVNRMIVNNIVGAAMQEKLNEWYKNWSEEIRKANQINDEKERQKQLRDINNEYEKLYEDLYQEGYDQINSLKEMGAIQEVDTRSQQSATANSIQNISYDQADSLVGIGLNHTMLFEQGKEELTLLNAKAEQISILSAESRDIAADSRDILAGMAIHVEEIRDGVVDTIVPRIKNIDDNLNKVYKIVEAQ